MGQFTNKILAEFQPPKKWKLGRDLVYTTTDLYANEVKALKDVGVKEFTERKHFSILLLLDPFFKQVNLYKKG